MVIIAVTLLIGRFTAMGAFIFVTIVTLMMPLFVKGKVDGWAYEWLPNSYASNRRVLKCYRMKMVIYSSIGFLLLYAYVNYINAPYYNLLFWLFATTFVWISEIMIGAILLVLFIQAIVLIINRNMSVGNRRKLETYTPWVVAGVIWLLAIRTGRRR